MLACAKTSVGGDRLGTRPNRKQTMPTMPTWWRVLWAALAIFAVIDLVRGRSLVPWRRQEHPLRTRGFALSLLLIVASQFASLELRAFKLGFFLLGLSMVVLVGAVMIVSRQGR